MLRLRACRSLDLRWKLLGAFAACSLPFFASVCHFGHATFAHGPVNPTTNRCWRPVGGPRRWRTAFRAQLEDAVGRRETLLQMGSAEVASSLYSGEHVTMSEDAVEALRRGHVAVVRNWLPPSLVAALRGDAADLFGRGLFGGEGKGKQDRDPTTGKRIITRVSSPQDRKTFRGSWQDGSIGDIPSRRQLEHRVSLLRSDLAQRLDHNMAGAGEQRISYNKFGPGAFLGRHFDERHEELKGVFGWLQPQRLAYSWLVYLNEDWDVQRYGGALRTYQRVADVADDGGRVGDYKGFLQVGWFRDVGGKERPVYMDSVRTGMRCALFVIKQGAQRFITEDFRLPSGQGPIPFERYISDDIDVQRFRRFAEPSLAEDTFVAPPAIEEVAVDVPPEAGTLVVFDSVALPHEVMETTRDRWAVYGWFSEPVVTDPVV